MKVINLFAGPGAGKSTTAAGLFFHMKIAGYKVELVREYAKELHYREDWLALTDQLQVSREQLRRQTELRNKVDWAITDSPILLGLVYGGREIRGFEKRLLQSYRSFDNVNFVVNRVKPYQPYGRRQSEASARNVDSEVKQLLAKYELSWTPIDGDERAPQRILNHLKGTHHIAA